MLAKKTEGSIARGMRLTKRARLLAAGVIAVCVLSGVAISIAWATPGSGVTTTILTGPIMLDDIHAMSVTDDHTAVINTRGFSDVYVVHNKIAPGGHTGWHSHPGISFVSVKAGQVTEYNADDPGVPHVFPAGTGFVEEAGRVHIMRNEGTTDLELVAFQIIPLAATRRIDEPAP